MHSSKRLEAQPRAHRLDYINCCALSDCCGAPIMQGGICFDCREHCEEEDGAVRSFRSDRAAASHDDRLVLADIERPDISFGDEDTSSVFDGISLSSASD